MVAAVVLLAAALGLTTTPTPGAGSARASAGAARALTRTLSRADSVEHLLGLYDEHGEALNSVHVATFWHTAGRLTRAHKTSKEASRALRGSRHPSRAQTIRFIGHSDERQLSGIAWGAASAGLDQATWPALWPAVTSAATDQLRLQEGRAAGDEAGGWTTQGLANLAWACATANHRCPELFDVIGAVAAPRVSRFKPQELSMLVWAYATAEHAGPEVLFAALLPEATARLEDMSGQSVANSVWAFAKLQQGLAHASIGAEQWAALYRGVAAQAEERASQLGAQELSNVAWALAYTEHATPSSLDAISAAASERLGDFTPHGLTSLVWAHASAGHAAPALFDAVALQLERLARKQRATFGPLTLSLLAWSYATAGHRSDALFRVS